MHRRLRTNLLLAAVIAALGMFIWLAPEPTSGTQVAVFAPDASITRIDVFDSGALRFTVQADGDQWNVTAPFALPADEFQVNALLDSLHEPVRRRYAAADADLAALGLEQPRWRLHVNGHELLLGDRTALGSERYLLKDGFVYLVGDVLSYRVQRNPLDYASRRVLPKARDVQSIALPDGTRLAKSGVAWTLQPEDSAVTTDALHALVDAWRHATALNVTPADSVPRDGEVSITFDDGTELRFGVEIRDETLLLTRADPAVTYFLPRAAAEELLALPPPAQHHE